MKTEELSRLCLEHRRAYLDYSRTALSGLDARVGEASARSEELRRQLAAVLLEEARLLTERDAHASAHRLESALKDAWLEASERYHRAQGMRTALREAA